MTGGNSYMNNIKAPHQKKTISQRMPFENCKALRAFLRLGSTDMILNKSQKALISGFSEQLKQNNFIEFQKI